MSAAPAAAAAAAAAATGTSSVALGWDGAITIVVLALGLIVMMADWLAPHLTFTLMVGWLIGRHAALTRKCPPTARAHAAAAGSTRPAVRESAPATGAAGARGAAGAACGGPARHAIGNELQRPLMRALELRPRVPLAPRLRSSQPVRNNKPQVGVLMAATVIDTKAGAAGFSNTGVLTVRAATVPSQLAARRVFQDACACAAPILSQPAH